jgi:general secretion pathway protein H
MPTSVPGSSPRRHDGPPPNRVGGGFTLIELLVVIAIVALAAGVVMLSLPDPAATRLEHEGARLVSLLEGARAEARTSGLDVRWVPGDGGLGGTNDGVDSAAFRFIGLPPALKMPTRWLDDRVVAQVVGNNVVTLGPDAILPAQRIVLRLDDRRLELATDGLSPFAVATPAADGAP